MKYGYLDDNIREYVIQTPAALLPWVSYLEGDGFFGLVPNTGGGYNFYRGTKLCRTTCYRYSEVPVDMGGRCYYIKNGGGLWSPGLLPCRTELKDCHCHRSLGYTVLGG